MENTVEEGNERHRKKEEESCTVVWSIQNSWWKRQTGIASNHFFSRIGLSGICTQLGDILNPLNIILGISHTTGKD